MATASRAVSLSAHYFSEDDSSEDSYRDDGVDTSSGRQTDLADHIDWLLCHQLLEGLHECLDPEWLDQVASGAVL